MIKRPVVAGSFYPNGASELTSMLDYFFTLGKPSSQTKRLFGMIVPHAGYIYSGATAANMYQIAEKYSYKNAIIIAPSHHCNHIDFFIGDYAKYETPLGAVPTNRQMIEKLLTHPEFSYDNRIDSREHALEVQLPFIAYALPNVSIVPIIFCRQNLENAVKLSKFLQEIYADDTLIIISTDLSHFHDARTAERIDDQLIVHIKNMDIPALYTDIAHRNCEACGFGGVLTLLQMAKNASEAEIDDIIYTHSGKVSGDNHSVVGYVSCGVYC